ncbi:MAG: transcriptional regulator MirA [Candidatus Accumulibacter adjunctus]|uniref:Transcriptional regulator MirA n=1 Tax=Candidatus Accumulibacter adjunctus TaxID=1454001 RepID=A0A011MDC4_9PROT|nr:MAG: transcriptional regulator MirA [Candidatus Accumulibacter adjunctus]
MVNTGFNIAAVERDTGLSKDVLRVWERRYGFPAPARDDHGERIYPAEQVERLRLVKRLMDAGHRPGKLLATPTEELNALAPRRPQPPQAVAGASAGEELDDLISLIKRHDGGSYQQAMQQRLARQGLVRFVQDTVAPLTRLVGTAWEEGRIEVFEEHLFTELTMRLLRQAIASLPGGKRSPRIILTSVPDELHGLGLLMAEALFALEGAECIPLGTQMPLLEIASAAGAHRADIVTLSFSVAFPQRQIPGLLQQLRTLLSADVELWAGGGGVRRLPEVAGVKLLASLEQSLDALAAWRGKHT